MFASIVRNHADRYPKMQIQDVYKLVHQAAMGSEHAAMDAVKSQQGLIKEMEELGNSPIVEPMLDPISPDGEIIRVHLRPFLKVRKDVSILAEAFHRTAITFNGQTDVLESYWKSAIQTKLFPSNLMEEFFLNMKRQNYTAVHHSDIYRQAYHPAYRVVCQKFFPYNESGG
jgi:hypothetical protein